MSDPETPEGGEPTEGGERTRESEIKADVEFWKDLGIEVDEVDVRVKIEELPEVEGFNWYFYIPKGVKTNRIWEEMVKRFWIIKMEGIGDLDNLKSPRSNAKDSYAVVCQYQREPDEDTLGKKAKSALEWEKISDHFLSLPERIVAELRWHDENKNHLDKNNITSCPDSRTEYEKIPSLGQDIGKSESLRFKIYLRSASPNFKMPFLGVRRVITKDTKV